MRMAFVLMLGCTLFGYVAFRAYTLSFTHDESLSYLNVKLFKIAVTAISHQENVTTVTLQADRITSLLSANTHILNSLLMLISSALFGNGELALRLPNLAAFILYLVYAYKIVRRLGRPLLVCGAYVIMITNPFVLDFFCLARGYGLATACMLVSMYYFIPSDPGATPRRLPAYAWAMAAVYANFTLLNFYLALWATDLLFIYQGALWPAGHGHAPDTSSLSQRIVVILKQYRVLFVVNTAFIVVTFAVMLPLYTGKQFYFGSSAFWSGSVFSLVCDSLYQKGSIALVRSIYTLVLLAAGLLSVQFAGRTYRSGRLDLRHMPFCVLVISMLLCLLQHLLLKSPYPESRTGLYFIILFWISLFSGYSLFTLPSLQTAGRVSILGCALFSAWGLVQSCNTDYVLSWKYEAHTREVFERANAHRTELGIYADWIFEPTLNYYRFTHKASHILPISRSGSVPSNCRYFYYSDTTTAPRTPPGEGIHREVFRDTGTILDSIP